MMARGARTRPRGRKRGIVLLLLAASVVGGSVAASQLTTSAMLEPPSAQPVPMADAGTAYCPVITTGQDDTAQLEIASASTEEASEVLVTRFSEGQPRTDDPLEIEAGQSVVMDISVEQAGAPIAVSWRGGPVVVQYRLTPVAAAQGGVGAGDQAVATCQTQPSDRWHLAGFDTTRGSRSTLYLFNPFEQDAVVDLQFGTAEGPVELVIAGEIQVPAGAVVVQDLAELRPETVDLAVTVRTQVGRVIPQGRVRWAPAGEGLEGVTGHALLPAVAEPSSELFVPEAVHDEVTRSWVTVYNPTDRAAAVQVRVSTPLGDARSLASELTVPAGGVARVDLADLSALPRMGVRLQSVNGIGLIATRVSAVQDGDRAGVAIAVAAPSTDTTWTVVGARGPDAQLVLYNPGIEVATARIDLAGADGSLDPVEVPPNGLTAVSLPDVEAGGAARISADQPLVVGGVNLSTEVATAFWSSTGTAESALLGADQAVRAQREPSLSSVPVRSATATPTPAPPDPVPPGEGELDPAPSPSLVPTPTATPTPSPGSEPTAPEVQATPTPPSPTPSGDTTEPDGPAASDPATDPTATETEGSLFG
ncbi:MAG TPA: DUF5719 family protein [Euzebya sp.]|nr:DUF5719 family protein [Euzebya sp.]